MRTTPTVVNDNAEYQPAAMRSANTLTKTASYTITQADLMAAGGHLVVKLTGTSATVLTLPTAAHGKGCRITMHKPAGDTDAYSFQATGGAKINNGTADKKFENATNQIGSCTIWSDGTDWFVESTVGTWANNNS